MFGGSFDFAAEISLGNTPERLFDIILAGIRLHAKNLVWISRHLNEPQFVRATGHYLSTCRMQKTRRVMLAQSTLLQTLVHFIDTFQHYSHACSCIYLNFPR